MSVNKNIYTIVGYDLKEYRKEVMKNDFYDSKLYDELTYDYENGNIKLFDDGMCCVDLYFGYIVGKINEEDYEGSHFIESKELEDIEKKVKEKLKTFYSGETGPIKYITFVETT